MSWGHHAPLGFVTMCNNGAFNGDIFMPLLKNISLPIGLASYFDVFSSTLFICNCLERLNFGIIVFYKSYKDHIVHVIL